MRFIHSTLSAAALIAGLALATTVHAQDNTAPAKPSVFVHDDGTPFTADEKIELLQQELDTLKRQRDLDQEVASGAAAKTATPTLDKKGLGFTSPDGKYQLGLNFQVNVDAHSFGNASSSDSGGALQDEVVDRLIRPTISGRAGNASFRITPEFGGSSSAAASIVDAYVEYKVSDPLQFRAGKFKSPLGLERLQADADVNWTERGLSTNLVPNRDVGYQLFGTAIPGVLEYQVGLFNGAADGVNLNNDTDNHKDVAARIFATPFANSDFVWLQGFGIGWAGSDGKHVGTTANPQLASYKSVGQQTFFKYATGAYSNGKLQRSNPQAYFYLDNFGLLVDYVQEKQDVALGAAKARLTNSALDISGAWALTGESEAYKGGIKPAHDFVFGGNGWGAVELTARYGENTIDGAAFSGGFASAATSARKATDTGIGLAWYWSENLKLIADWDRTKFKGGAAAGADRKTEDFASGRIQLRY